MFGRNKTETTSYFEEFIPFEKTLKTETSQEKLSSALKKLEWSRSKLAAILLKVIFNTQPCWRHIF